MLNLYEIMKNRLTATTATPLATAPKNIKNDKGENMPNADRTQLENWVEAVEKLRAVTYSHVVNGTKTVDEVFAAWKACLAFFPESMTGKRARPDADDYAALCSLATKYQTRSAEARKDGEQAKTWADVARGTFRKGVEDLSVNRIDNTKFKTIEQHEADRAARKTAQEAARKARIAEVMEREHCSEEQAKRIIKMVNAQKRAERAKKEADAAKKDVEAAKKAAKPAPQAAPKTAKKATKTTKTAKKAEKAA